MPASALKAAKAKPAPRRAAGRPRRFTHEQIVQAALAVMEREGFAALTIRALADELRITSSVLYNYFERIEDIETEALQQLAAGIPTPKPGTPRELRRQLIDCMLTVRNILIRHPGVLNPPMGSRAWDTFTEVAVQWVLTLKPYAVDEISATAGHSALISTMALSAERERIYGPDYQDKMKRHGDRRVQRPRDLRVVLDCLIDGLFPRLPR